MTSGFDIALAVKAMTPLFGALTKTASGPVEKGIEKWKAKGFAKRLLTKLASADRVKTIWSRDRFVSLTDCYYPSRIDKESASLTINSINELPHRHVVIEGIVGQGKSMFIQYLYLQELSGKGSGGLPLLIFLRTITPKRGLAEHLNDALSNLEIEPSNAVFDYLAKSEHLILMLDGFDELDPSLVTETITEIDSLIFKYPMMRVIITSRPNSDIQKSQRLDVLQLSGLEYDDYDPFLKKLSVDIVRREEITNAIKTSPADIVELISTPLMLTLVAHVYAAEKEIPSELPLFFERLFATTFVNHDKQKGGGFRRHHHSGLSDRKLQLLFEAFCFLTLQKGIGRTLTGEQFSQVFDSALNLVEDAQCSAENFKQDITKVACLMLDDGFDQTSFLHMSIAEYFAAAFIMRSNEKFAARFYEYAIGTHRTLRVVLNFLEKIDSYRFSKFYIIPPLKRFFDALNSTPNHHATDEAWLALLRTTLTNLEANFSNAKASGKLMLSRMQHDTTIEIKYGTIVSDLVHSAILNIVAARLFDKSMFSENAKWLRHEQSLDGDIDYVARIDGLIAIFGGDEFLKAFRPAEYSLWVRYNEAKALVENEDSKTNLIFW
ncbi:NACHT domain-containing protein [Massilia sp. PDC64]|nr:NACHT domain-containing protein [Massilia sp. PDC64]SDC80688.1 NACHT domain-containing protein [Massilia sp. PDC64]